MSLDSVLKTLAKAYSSVAEKKKYLLVLGLDADKDSPDCITRTVLLALADASR